jgi:type 1 glutamine amidotransferase
VAADRTRAEGDSGQGLAPHVRIVEDPDALASPKLKGWDAVIIHFMDWEKPGPGPEARENLKQFVSSGKGMMLTHFACGAWDGDEWPEFKNLAGRVWDPKLRGHDPHGKFRVDVADAEHPITKGLEPFETIDELYTCLTGDAPIHVVAKATSKVDKKDYPMAFVLDYGKGRVWEWGRQVGGQSWRTATARGGSFEGIGAMVTMKDGVLSIVSVFEGQPAEKAGGE